MLARKESGSLQAVLSLLLLFLATCGGDSAPPTPSFHLFLAPKTLAHPRSDWTTIPESREGFYCGTSQTPTFITIHHGGTTTKTTDAVKILRSYYDWHTNGHGWCDIGYHFMVNSDGTIWQLRDENYRGIHACAANADNVGIVLPGNYMVEQPNQAMLDSTAEVLRWLGDTYHIPMDKSAVKGHADWPNGSECHGQCACRKPECPGKNLYPLIPDLLETARSLCGTLAPVCSIAPGSGAPDETTGTAFGLAEQRLKPQLGCAADNGGSCGVHSVYGVLLQDYFQSDRSKRFVATDGWAALAYNRPQKKAYLLRGGFWGAYKCLTDQGHLLGGATLLGAPKEDEHPAPGCVAWQEFENGHMSWDGLTLRVDVIGPINITAQAAAVSQCVNVKIANNPPIGPGSVDTSKCPLNQTLPTKGSVEVFEVVGQWANDIREPTQPGFYAGLDSPQSSGIKFQIPLSWLIDETDNLITAHMEDFLSLANTCYGRKAIVSIVPVYPNYKVMGDLPKIATPAHWLDVMGGPVPTVQYSVPAEDIDDTVVPVIWDPAFQVRYRMALAKIGAFYDGDPRIDHLDVGIGNWGETALDRRFGRADEAAIQTAWKQWMAAGWSQANWLAAVDGIVKAQVAAFPKTASALMITDIGYRLLNQIASDATYDPAKLQGVTQAMVTSAQNAGIRILQYDGLLPEPVYASDFVMFDVVKTNLGAFDIALEARGPSPDSYRVTCNPIQNKNCWNTTFLGDIIGWAQQYNAKYISLWPGDVNAARLGMDNSYVADAIAGKAVPFTACTPATCIITCAVSGNNLLITAQGNFERGLLNTMPGGISRVLPGDQLQFFNIAADVYGWALPPNEAIAHVNYSGNNQPHTLSAPNLPQRFNLWARMLPNGAAKTVDWWFDLRKWSATGANCKVVSDGMGGLVIDRH